MKNTITILLLALLPIIGCGQSDSKKLTNAEVEKVIERLSSRLIRSYVYQDKAERMVRQIQQQFESNQYDGLTSPQLAESLTKDLHSVVLDKHLAIAHSSKPSKRAELGYPSRAEVESKLGFERVEVLEGNIGFIDLIGLVPLNNQVSNRIAEVFEQLKDVDALIIDLRKNGGGSAATVGLVSSYFFDRPPFVINSVYNRQSNQTSDFRTTDKVNNKLPNTPIYLLISELTFSAAEEFCYNLQQLKRATIVGEPSRGGAHPTSSFSLPNGLNAYIPNGRAINPISKTNWEGVGVVPDIKIDAELALDKAIELIIQSK
ncbi:MAG: S41 family peptidase [Cyclobacteriaceae bacterium]